MEKLVRISAALSPRYRVECEVGQGGSATVYRAETAEPGPPVAVKVLDSDFASAVGPSRFQREIRIARSLSHPRILPVLDAGEADGLLFYVMPFVEGRSLAERLEAEGQLPVEEALNLVREVGEGLDHAHAAGVVHRDIKPANILLGPEGAIIADFGIARMIAGTDDDRLTATGHHVGTVAYMSPEQAGGARHIDARTDVYSLACVLFEMLAGEPPFTGPTAQAVVARHMAQAAPTLEVVRADLPPAVVAAVSRALSKAPADRFASPGQFVEALTAGRPVLSRRTIRRRWILATGAAGLAVAIGMAVPARLSVGPLLAADKVVVLPLASTSAIDDPSAGWDVALAIEAALEHAEPLRFIDGWTWLGAAQRADPGLVTAEVAHEVAVDRGAGFYLAGAIRESGDSVSVVVRLHDVVTNSLVAQETVTGASANASLGTLGMQALLGLLPLLVDPGRPVDLSPLTDRVPAATALFLQGERAYRQFQFEEALEFYRRAVAADSLHAFAAIKGAQAADWEDDLGEARDLVALALRHKHLLPPKYRHFAEGLDGFLAGDAEAALAGFAKAVERDPDWTEALSATGEVYMHGLPNDAVNPDSVAAFWLTAARAQDSAFALPLYHLAEIEIRAGHLDVARQLLDSWREFEPDEVYQRQIELSLACLTEGPANFDWWLHTEEDPLPVFQAGVSMAGRASNPGCAEGALNAILRADLEADPWHGGAILGLRGLALTRGDYERADSLLALGVAEGVSMLQVFYLYDALAGAPFHEQAEATAAIIQEAVDDGAPWPDEYRWLLGLWLARKGDADGMQGVLATVPTDSAGAMSGPGTSLRAHGLAMSGDTTAALSLLRQMAQPTTREFLQVTWWGHQGMERLLAAELYAAQGLHIEAYEVAALLDHATPLAYLPLLPRSLVLRIESAEAMNRPDLADAARARLVALGWSDIAAVPPAPR